MATSAAKFPEAVTFGAHLRGIEKRYFGRQSKEVAMRSILKNRWGRASAAAAIAAVAVFAGTAAEARSYCVSWFNGYCTAWRSDWRAYNPYYGPPQYLAAPPVYVPPPPAYYYPPPRYYGPRLSFSVPFG
jgi:hypothetical protein